jgi:putative ABC transport system permease protein
MMLDVTEVEGYRPRNDRDMTFHASSVGPAYFEALGTRLVAGRPFTARDDERGASVVIVNETAARKYWSDGAPVGRRLKIGEKTGWATVVGVVEDVKGSAIDEPPAPMLYWPFDQPVERELTADTAHLLVRSEDAAATAARLDDTLRAVDPSVPAYGIRTFDEVVSTLVMPQRMGVTLLACFSLVALVLAALGIYGVAAYVAALRTREIGIRMALGADRRSVARLMLRTAAVPVFTGIVAGLALALWAGQLATAFLHGTTARDPLALAAVVALMTAIALTASYLPARRAARVDPVAALRLE